MKKVYVAQHADMRIAGEFPFADWRDEHINGWPEHVRKGFKAVDVDVLDDHAIVFPRQTMSALGKRIEEWKGKNTPAIDQPTVIARPNKPNMRSREFALAHGATRPWDGESTVRATVRTDRDGLTAVTTCSRGTFQTVFYTAEERAALVEALQASEITPLRTMRVEWGKDRE